MRRLASSKHTRCNAGTIECLAPETTDVRLFVSEQCLSLGGAEADPVTISNSAGPS